MFWRRQWQFCFLVQEGHMLDNLVIMVQKVSFAVRKMACLYTPSLRAVLVDIAASLYLQLPLLHFLFLIHLLLLAPPGKTPPP